MKLKLLISRAGADFSQSAGDVINVSDAEGKRMIEAAQAIPHVESKTETTTNKKQTQKAVKE